MSANINLVDKRTPEDSKKEKIKKIKGISFAILALTAFFALLIFTIDYRFSASYVKKQQSDLLRELSAFEDTSARIFIVNTKLSDISKIISQRKKYNMITSQIASANSGGATVEEFIIDDSGINLIVSSTSLEVMDSFLNSLIELADENIITGILIKKFTFETDKYVVEISMI